MTTSTPRGEQVGTPHDLRWYVHVAYNGLPVVLQLHHRDNQSNESDLCWRSGNMSSEAVPNEKRNGCTMATDIVPNDMEYEHLVYSIACWIASRAIVNWIARRLSLRSSNVGYHSWRTTHGDLSRHYGWMEYWTEYQTALPEAYKMTLREKCHTKTRPNADSRVG